jgi:hypothetical protein
MGAIMCETARLPTALRIVSFTAARGAIIEKQAPQWSLLGLEEASCCCSLWSSSQTLPAESSPSSGRTEHILRKCRFVFQIALVVLELLAKLQRHNTKNSKQIFPELVVLVDFVFPWGIEYPVVFLPQGLFTLWCLQMD